jgi:hypothetical protein
MATGGYDQTDTSSTGLLWKISGSLVVQAHIDPTSLVDPSLYGLNLLQAQNKSCIKKLQKPRLLSKVDPPVVQAHIGLTSLVDP